MEKTIKNITKLSSKMPKTLNEALNFNENEDFNDVDMNIGDGEEEVLDVPQKETMPEPNNASEKAKKLIDDIRKMALRAMAELADTPEDESYIMLKKVWSTVDRKQEQQQEKPSI